MRNVLIRRYPKRYLLKNPVISSFSVLLKLLPLNRCRRLGGYVEDYAVHPAGLSFADAAGYCVEEVVGEADPFGGHGVERGDGAGGRLFRRRCARRRLRRRLRTGSSAQKACQMSL